MIPKRVIICGSGASLRQGLWETPIIKLPVWDKIKDEFVISTNWNFRYFNPTITVFADYKFYITERENLSKLPLVFTGQDYGFAQELNKEWQKIYHFKDNIYLLPRAKGHDVGHNRVYYWGTDAWKNGFWKHLSGILGMILGIACGCTEIYCLGFDACATNGHTHFYEDDETVGITKDEKGKIKCGVGFQSNGKFQTDAYNKDINKHFRLFIPELKRMKIINVSPDSKITVFPKISYNELYNIIQKNPNKISQNKIRESVLSLYKQKLGVK